MEQELSETFQRSVEEGTARLTRSWPSLLATGAVGGLDVTIGVFAMLVVRERTGSELLGALAFSLGFIALTLANSELFTENFLVPVAAIVAKDAPWWSLPRLWIGTLFTNLIGGWIAIGLVLLAFPGLHALTSTTGARPIALGIGLQSFASSILAGLSVTLMTWMDRGTDSVTGRLASAVGIAFLLAAAPLDHAVVASIEMFGALQVGAPFGYLDWLGMVAWMSFGNLIGGIGLVTMLRLIQVGGREIKKEQRHSPPSSEDGEI